MKLWIYFEKGEETVGRQKTNEDFLNDLMIKNPNFMPLGTYINNSTKLLFRCCICGTENYIQPKNVLSGKGCKTCANKKMAEMRRKSTEQLIEELKNKKPDVELIGEYINTNYKNTLFRCKKCGEEFCSKPAHILEGHGCPICGGSKRKSTEQFIIELAKVNQFIEVCGNYVNARTPIACHCKICLNDWNSTTPSKLLMGSGCPICDKRNKSSFPEQAILFYVKKTYTDVLNRYTGIPDISELDIYIPSISVAIEYDGIWHNNSKAQEKDRKKYKECVNKGIYLIRVREVKTRLNDNLYADYVIYRDEISYESLDYCIMSVLKKINAIVTVNSFSDSTKIREQYYIIQKNNSIESKYPTIATEWYQEKNGKILPDMVSYAANEKYYWKCNVCNNEWIAAPCDRTIGGKGCPVCGKKKVAEKLRKKHEDYLSQLESVNPDVEVLEIYINAHHGLKSVCKVCGYGKGDIEWRPTPANLLKGRKCPICSRKKRYVVNDKK